MASFGRQRFKFSGATNASRLVKLKSGQVKRFQATEGEMQAAMAWKESGGCMLCEYQAGTCHNWWY